MAHTLPALLLLLCFVVASISAYSPTYTGDQWQSEDAQTKLNTLSQNVYANTSSSTWYSVAHLAELFAEDMNISFDFVGDDMPSQFLLSTERPKLIHTVGAIAPIQYTPVPGSTQYTGFFRGTNTGYIRLSLAAPPTSDPPLITPGVSLKFLRDGQPSGDVVAMYSIQGTSDFNYFEHDLTNHPGALDPSNLTTAVSALLAKFSEASNYPNMVGLSALATYDQSGNAENPINFPFRIIFHPVDAVHSLFSSEPTDDQYFFLPQFESIPAGDLFELWAQADPADPDNLEHIGTITTLSALSGSQYADLNLFFEHTRFETDLNFNPQWKTAADAAQAQQSSTPYFRWPDLPWNSAQEQKDAATTA
jgi:hypothetical protein